MKSLTYNLNSVEVFYGDNVLTSVIQNAERVNDIAKYLNVQGLFTDIKRRELSERIDKLNVLNRKIQNELERQIEKLQTAKVSLESSITVV